MNLKLLLKDTGLSSQKDIKDIDVVNITYDSKEVRKGFLFFAITGQHHDGNNFIEDVIKKGAKVIICDKRSSLNLSQIYKDIVFIFSEDIKKTLSKVSKNFFQNPEESLIKIGISGTDGKTSISFYIYQLLKLLGYKTGFFSTALLDTDGKLIANKSRQSTPESLECFKFLAQMKENNFKYAVLEATSHGLSHRYSRLIDIDFQIGIISKIGHEHMDFHKTKEQYRSDKANLFRQLKDKKDFKSKAILNYDDKENFDYLYSLCKEKLGDDDSILTFSTKDKNAKAYATEIKSDLNGNSFLLNYLSEEVKIESPLLGEFFIENIIPVIICVYLLTGKTLQEISPFIKELKNPTGRMELFEKNGIKVLVDYAHTPESFESIFSFFKDKCNNNLIAIFGSAGERDKEKRKKQGGIAGRYCDKVYITDEDPRDEKGIDIINEIASGIENENCKIFKIEDRDLAIKTAIKNAEKGDLVLTLGKGNEGCIFYENSRQIFWDEKQSVLNALSKI